MKLNKKINIRPTTGVYGTYRRLSYHPWTAIAEFVDNSTQSFFDHKEELIRINKEGLVITIDYKEDKINGDMLVIKDNAYGMEWDDFQRAVILDRPPANTLGRNEFGMGLKTAACWFGSLWSVESTQLNSAKKYYTEIDINNLEKFKSEEINVIEENTDKLFHYTQITIKNLHKKINGPRTISAVKSFLSSIYRTDLRSGLIKIYYNGTLLKFKEPQIFVEESINDTQVTWKKNIEFVLPHDGKELHVSGFVAIRIPGSVKEAGFSLLRRGRVIIGGSERNYRPSELFGDSNSYAYQRLFGELNMDNWPVTQAKDSFDWHDSGLEEAFINKLLKLTYEYRKKAESIRIRDKINTLDLMKSVVNDFHESGIVESLSVDVNQDVNTCFEVNDNKLDEYTTNNSEECSKSVEVENNTNVTNNNVEGVEFEGGNYGKYCFKYNNYDYIFNIKFDIESVTSHWLLVQEINEDEFNIQINTKHSFFKPLIDKKEFIPIMIKVCIALVLAEIDSNKHSVNGKINACDIRLKMNEILETIRRSGE